MNNKQALFFLWATILNQSQKAETVLENTKMLMERLKLIKDLDKNYKDITYTKIETAMLEKPTLHRFPKNMSIYLYSSIMNINDNYKEVKDIFNGSLNEIESRISSFLGIGKHKTEVAMVIFKEYIKGKNEIGKDILYTKCTTLPQTIFKEFEILDELGD